MDYQNSGGSNSIHQADTVYDLQTQAFDDLNAMAIDPLSNEDIAKLFPGG